MRRPACLTCCSARRGHGQEQEYCREGCHGQAAAVAPHHRSVAGEDARTTRFVAACIRWDDSAFVSATSGCAAGLLGRLPDACQIKPGVRLAERYRIAEAASAAASLDTGLCCSALGRHEGSAGQLDLDEIFLSEAWCGWQHQRVRRLPLHLELALAAKVRFREKAASRPAGLLNSSQIKSKLLISEERRRCCGKQRRNRSCFG